MGLSLRFHHFFFRRESGLNLNVHVRVPEISKFKAKPYLAFLEGRSNPVRRTDIGLPCSARDSCRLSPRESVEGRAKRHRTEQNCEKVKHVNGKQSRKGRSLLVIGQRTRTRVAVCGSSARSVSEVANGAVGTVRSGRVVFARLQIRIP